VAPGFSCRTISGDSIFIKDFEGKYLLLANITACWSPIMSYEYYRQMCQEYSSKFDILAIDKSPNALRQNIEDLNLEGEFVIADSNLSIKENYREDYCSRTCFLIDPSGRIVDKFEIGDWRTALKNYFD
jgi:glutathione peroxidase-family protein